MANPLLDRVQPELLAERGQSIEFKGKVGDLPRLVQIVEADLAVVDEAARPRGWKDRPLEVRLEFGWLDPDHRVAAVSGRVAALIAAICQRCLEVFEWPLDTEFRLVVSRDEEGGPEGHEVWVTDEDSIRPLDLVEEAVVMALPLSPKHAMAGECGPLGQTLEAREPDTVRPFADLRAQMDRSKQ